MGHCLASNRSGETRNILLHWMQTRWMTGLMTAPGGIERAKAGAEDFGSDADAGKPGVVHQQQWKGRAYFAVCDASATGYVCGKGACDGGTDGQERASDSGIGCKGCGGEAH